MFPAFVTYHAGFKREKFGVSPSLAINLLFRSVELHHPGCHKFLLTDETTTFHRLHPDIKIRRFPVDPAKTMLSRMQAESLFLSGHSLSSPLVLLDSDMLINGRLDILSSDDIDLAVTYRPLSETRSMKRGAMAVNAGILFLFPSRAGKALAFFETVHKIFKTKYDRPELWWWGEQLALMDVIGQSNIPEKGSVRLWINDTLVSLLPCETYNFSPDPFYRSLRAPLNGKKILHFKGYRKKLMPCYFDLHLAPDKRGFLKSLKPRLTFGLSLVRETILPPWMQRRFFHGRLRLISRNWSKRMSKALTPIRTIRNDFVLKKILRGQRVLIVGSGPSAGELNNIPPDMRVLTCNAGLKLFVEKKLTDKVDLFFFVKSKAGKTFLVDGKQVPKTRYIEGLLEKIRVNVLVATHPESIRRNKTLKKNRRLLLTDSGRSPHYLLPLIHPHSVQEISQQSSLSWTSTGLRLLQYALYFGAKEIYLAGIDLGANGYFWGPNTNPWRHDFIDENFVKLISKRYKNVYSFSANSPIRAYLPFRPFETKSETNPPKI